MLCPLRIEIEIIKLTGEPQHMRSDTISMVEISYFIQQNQQVKQWTEEYPSQETL
jgi:hypothetical protein